MWEIQGKWLAPGVWPGSGSSFVWIQSECSALLPDIKASSTTQLLTFLLITWSGCLYLPAPLWWPCCANQIDDQYCLFFQPWFKLFLPPGILFLLIFYLGKSDNPLKFFFLFLDLAQLYSLLGNALYFWLSLREGVDRGWVGWMASPAQWTWVWANSRR